MPLVPTTFPPGTPAWAVAIVSAAVAVLFFTHTFGPAIRGWAAARLLKADEQRLDRATARDRDRDQAGDSERIASLVVAQLRAKYDEDWGMLTRHSERLYLAMMGTEPLGSDGVVSIIVRRSEASEEMQAGVARLVEDLERRKKSLDDKMQEAIVQWQKQQQGLKPDGGNDGR